MSGIFLVLKCKKWLEKQNFKMNIFIESGENCPQKVFFSYE